MPGWPRPKSIPVHSVLKSAIIDHYFNFLGKKRTHFDHYLFPVYFEHGGRFFVVVTIKIFSCVSCV